MLHSHSSKLLRVVCLVAIPLTLLALPALASAHGSPTVQVTPTEIAPGSTDTTGVASVRFRLASSARVSAMVARNGRTVRRLAQGWRRRGTQRVVWDGRDHHGALVEPGHYRIVVRVRAPRHRPRARSASITVRSASPATSAPLAPSGPPTLQWPVAGNVTSGFGPRGSSHHDGVDIIAEHGAAILAAAPGIVTFAGWMGGYGNTVMIEHPGDGYVTLYAHQSRVHVAAGDEVAQTSIIGYVGNTGHTTATHLHLELRTPEGRAIDPRPHLPRR